jgi:hypothetical protein
LREILSKGVLDPKLTCSSSRGSAAPGKMVRGLIGNNIRRTVKYQEGDFSAILA